MSRAREAARLIGNNTLTIATDNSIGIGSTTPDAKFDVNGVLSVAGIATFGTTSTVIVANGHVNSAGVVTASAAIVGSAVTIRSAGINVGVGFVTAREYDITGSTNTLSSGGLNVGIATVGSAVTVNSTGLNATGVITATAFRGDGSGLSGVSGFNLLDGMLFQ